MKIVVGYVTTDESRAALDWVVEQAKRCGDEVVVVHSIHGGGSMESEQQEILTYRAELDQIEERLTAEGIPHTVRRLIRGLSPAEDLTQVVKEEGADMIAIGLNDRSRTGKYLMGSDAQQIMMAAGCPVLGVKAAT